MKCEKCNEREASFFYTSDINGKVTKRCLCAQCAAEEGLLQQDRMFEDFFSSPFRLMDSFWNDSFFGEDFFSPFAPLATRARPVQIGSAPEKKSFIPDSVSEELREKRELKKLKNELKAAVKDENFERAIELRDEIRQREQRS